MKYYFFVIVITISLSSCFDIYESKNEIVGPYYVATDPELGCKTLYYEGENEYVFERILCVEKVGEAAGYIIVQKSDKFQYLNIIKDKPSDLGDPEVQNNISKPLNEKEFQTFLDSLNIKEIEFKFER